MGLTVLDAGVVIGFLDASDVHHSAAVEAIRAARDRGDDLVLPASALAEVLVGPARRGPDAVGQVHAVLDRLPMAVVPADAAVAARAALLRAAHGPRLRLPDALVIGTALHLSAAILLTTDRGWPTARSLGFAGRVVSVGA